MKYNIYLFDMDGVLLTPNGYHKSLQTSVKRVGLALGAPQTVLTDDHIAKLESLTITNEWDSLAICSAIILLHAWQVNKNLRLDGLSPNAKIFLAEQPDFDRFLYTFKDISDLPGHSCYKKIIKENDWLDPRQKQHLQTILLKSRDIYESPTLPAHQETVLGSQRYSKNYGLKPNLNIESFLLKYDHPNLTMRNQSQLREWMTTPENLVGILTNRPSGTPPGYLSSPEAEIGAELIDLRDLPILGSGMLAWFAATQCELPDHTFLKPNPVHTLGLLQMCLGNSMVNGLEKAVKLWIGHGERSDWTQLDRAKVTIFEDSVKGLQSGLSAQKLLKSINIRTNLNLIGVTKKPIKLAALNDIAHSIIPDINQISWK